MTSPRSLRQTGDQTHQISRDEEMRRFKSVIIAGAKRGGIEELEFLVYKTYTLVEFVIPEVFDALLEHLEASKVPSIETLPTSFKRKKDHFKNLVVERAFLSVQGLARAPFLKDAVRSVSSIRDLLKFRWPGVLAWLCYFYVGCFEKNLVDVVFKDEMARWLNVAFILSTDGDDLISAIGAVPGTIRLATLLCMLDNKGSYAVDNGLHMGTSALMRFFRIEGNVHMLDEVVEALDGNATHIVDTAVARLQKAVNSLEFAVENAMMHLSLLMAFASVPKDHSLWLALHRKSLIAIVTNLLLRLLDIPFTQRDYSPDSAMNVPCCISACIFSISSLIEKNTITPKSALQALEAGLLTALVNCAPLTFTFNFDNRNTIIHALRLFTRLSAHITIARQASAELERLENTLSVQGRINGSLPDVRDAWKVFYETILARREILAQMQALNSTPMSCDNCYKFDERASYKKCAGCGMAHYCSRDCQTRAWKEKGHRDECKSLKAKPVKTKHRALNQEKYFLARIAINDTQDKKEQLRLIASVGLNCVGVDVYYNFVPPRFRVSYDYSEIAAHREQVVAVIKGMGDPLSDTAETYRGYMKALRYVSGSHNGEEVQSETTHIQLNDNNSEQTSTNSKAPPVHLRVHVPHGERVQTEHFVVDDFWDFVQIKFDDLVLGSQDPEPDVVDAGRYEGDHPEHYTPEEKKELRRQRLSYFDWMLAMKSFDNDMKIHEDSYMLQVKDLWQLKNMLYQNLQSCEQLALWREASEARKTSDESEESANPAL